MGVADSIFKPHPWNFIYVFFKDVQMILVSFFDIPNQKSVNQEKTILCFQFSPPAVRFGPIWTAGGVNWKNKIGFSILISKNDANII